MTLPLPKFPDDTIPPAMRPRAPAIVRVSDLLIEDALIGIYDYELTRPQRLRVNLELAQLPDSLPLDPAQVAAAVAGHIRAGHTNLLESLAERLADLLLADQRIATALVRLEKLDAFTECEAVGVEILRRR